MIGKIARIGLLLAVVGCGGEPERSRVVPASQISGNSSAGSGQPAPGEIHKVETH
jgi:hypothetical protein